MLDNKFIEERKRDLLKEKERIEKELSSISVKKGKKFEPKYTDYGNDDDENAQEITQYELNFAIDEKLEKMLSKTIKALDKIKKGKYGISELSGEEINPERLIALPTAELTIEEEIEREKNPFKKLVKKIKNGRKSKKRK